MVQPWESTARPTTEVCSPDKGQTILELARTVFPPEQAVVLGLGLEQVRTRVQVLLALGQAQELVQRLAEQVLDRDPAILRHQILLLPQHLLPPTRATLAVLPDN